MPVYRSLIWYGIIAGWVTVSAQTQVTLHITNPWSQDANAELRTHLRMQGNEEVGGWYPGSDMTPEGGVWFCWKIQQYEKKGWAFKLVNWIGPMVSEGRVEYNHTFHLDSLLARCSRTPSDVWIVISDTGKAPQLFYDKPTVANAHGSVNPQKPANGATVSTLTFYTLSGRTIARLHPRINDRQAAFAEGMRYCRGAAGRILYRFDNNGNVSTGAVPLTVQSE